MPGASNELDAQAAPPAVLQPRLGRRRPPRGDVVVHEAAARRAEPSGKVDSLGDALVAWGVGRYWAAISDVQLSLPLLLAPTLVSMPIHVAEVCLAPRR